MHPGELADIGEADFLSGLDRSALGRVWTSRLREAAERERAISRRAVWTRALARPEIRELRAEFRRRALAQQYELDSWSHAA